MKRSKLTLLQKGLLVLALPLVYQAVLLGVLIKRQWEHSRAVEMAVHTKNVLLQLDELVITLLQGQANTRGYLLTRDAQYREAARATLQLLEPQERLIELIVSSYPVQRARLERIRALTQARIRWSTEVLRLGEEGRWDEAIAKVANPEGQRLMNDVQKEIGYLRSAEEELDRTRSEGLRQSAIQQNALLTFGLVLNVIIGGTVILLFNRGISSRMAVLSANMQRMGRGEPLQPEVGGVDEIAELDRGFHAMAAELVDAHEKEQVYQQTLERRNTELTRANLDSDHKNQENEMFVYSVSHDLRSPLVNLQGFSKELGLVSKELLELLNAETITEQSRKRALTLVERDVGESVHYIQTAVTRLSAIIDALLRLSRAGRVEYVPEMVAVNEVLQRVTAAMKGSIAERGATVTVLPMPPIWGDPTAVEQIFANLLANAVNYLDPERRGEIEIGHLVTAPESVRDMTVYYVKDNGVGIAEAYQPKIFGVFQRLHPKMAPGEGIGLPLVSRMVDRHGGKIWVESLEGKGSTFFFALPTKEHSPLTIAPRKESVRLFTRPA